MQYTTRDQYEHISTTSNDPIVERRTCRISWKEFAIYASDDAFYQTIAPTFAGQKIAVPRPTLCREERLRRRALFRNERKLYKRLCDATGENIISIYSSEKPYKVYNQKFRWSDARDPMSYGRAYDPTKTFTHQFDALMKDVPKLGIINDNGVGSINCDYTCDFVWGKDCYMCFEMGDCQECLYTHHSNGGVALCDSDEATSCRECYETLSSLDCYDCQYVQWCINCASCVHSDNLIWCNHCAFSCGLQNQSYQYMNQPVSKEEYEVLMHKLATQEGFLEQEIDRYRSSVYVPDANNHIRQSENCYGYNIANSSNLYFCYNSFYAKNIKYGRSLYQVEDCSDVQCWKSQNCYEGQTLDESYGSAFCARCSRSKYIFYSHNCHDCSYIFGCDGLRNKQYCIFNKQYTKEEYEALVLVIVTAMQQTGERWEFLDVSLTPFCYNETCAQEYYPMMREDALARWYHWQDISFDPVIPTGAEVVRPDEASYEQRQAYKNNDDIVKKIVVCKESWRPYRITKQELDFYRKHNIALPGYHPDIRHQKRLERLYSISK